MVVIALRRHRLLLALMALVAVACSSGAGVPWIYENDSNAASLHSSSVEVKAASATSTEDVASAQIENIGKNAPSKKKGTLWTWGGAPKGFTASNGTLYYPPGYYYPWTGFPESYYGYTKSGYYPGYNEPKTYSGYSFGYSSGTHPGFAIMSLLYPNSNSGYDPWNNYNTTVGRDYL